MKLERLSARKVIWPLAFFAILILRNEARANVDQEFVFQDWDFQVNVGGGNTTDWAQTFVIGVDGVLTGFDVWIVREPVVAQPLIFDIRDVLPSGVPTAADAGANVLANGMVEASSFPVHGSSIPFVLTHVELGASSFPVSAGQSLALALQTNDPGVQFNGVAYSWQGYGDGYASGGAFGRNPGSGNQWGTISEYGDVIFRTYVTPIPEPSTLLLFATASIGFLSIRRR